MKKFNIVANNINSALTKAEIFGWKSGKQGFTWVAEKATQAASFCEKREAKARAKAQTIEEKLQKKEGATVFDVFDAVSEEYSEPVDDTLDIEAHLDDDEYDEDPSVLEILDGQFEKLTAMYQEYLTSDKSQAKTEMFMVHIHAFMNLVPRSLQGFSSEEIEKILAMCQDVGAMSETI